MMSKFWFLTKTSFLKKAKSKWFIIINLILFIALVGILNIDSIIKMFGGDFKDTYKIVILDKTGYSEKVFVDSLNEYNKTLNMDFTFDIEESTQEQSVIEEEQIRNSKKVLIVLDEDENSYINASVISDAYIETSYYQLLYQSLTKTKEVISLSLSNIDKTELTKLMTPISINRVLLNENKSSTEETMSMVMGSVFPTVILPVFLLIVFMVQMIGAEINEEKQTRSMEVIISNVSPKAHFFSKMVAGNAFVLMQGALLIIYGLIALFIKNSIGAESTSALTKEISKIWDSLVSSGFVDKLYYILPLTLILMILSFITYSLIAGIFASMTVSMEDYQQIQTPIMLVLLLGYYLAIMAGMFNGSIFIKIASYLPFISCMLSPALLVVGQIGIIDVIISIVILIVFNGILIKYGMKIYKIGILNYSTDKMLKKIFKAMKTHEN